ncbi:GNAT family N-acetyltransferase [Pseudomonas sp. B2M1-30]|uniref:GNAT family N-acetyltransferase n=1 Tax=Pseudomonas TaxID=286 RepID=UPI0021C84103|nr:GNAT family N-acetyltransferase [Pseudomonas sp. B2M1-30]MCU7264002.1 GNAT family N-acetyltransferase [Pseudomonas koreensis]
MDAVILRNYRPGDATAISRLFRKIYGDHYAHHQVYLPWMINQNHAERRWHSLVAVEGKKVLGHASLCRDAGSHIAELALTVVDPQTRGQHIATQLGEQLLVHAQALGCRGVTIKQVTRHPYTQRMAATLGFQSTGLLPDYVPSPYGDPVPETLVIGYKAIDGYHRPLPALAWPSGCSELPSHLSQIFGITEKPSKWPHPAVRFEHCRGRYDVVIGSLDGNLLAQLRQLPGHWRISLRLRLTSGFTTALARLSAIGFLFTGLALDERGSGWMALLHRGHPRRRLQLQCPHMQRLHDQRRQPAESALLDPP